MLRYTTLLAIATISISIHAQTVYRISNATITEKDQVQKGMDVSAMIKGAEGSDRVVIFAGQDVTLESRVKVSTQNVKRSSVKSSELIAIFKEGKMSSLLRLTAPVPQSKPAVPGK